MITDYSDYLLDLGVRRAIAHIRAGRPNHARLALEVAVYAVNRVERGET